MNGKLMLYIDQYGCHHFARTVAELATELGYHPHSVRKMYADKKDGRTVVRGVVIGKYWLSRYAPVELAA